MKSAQKIRFLRTALWFFVPHPGGGGWAAPVTQRGGASPSLLCDPGLSVDSALIPGAWTCRRPHNGRLGRPCVWSLCVDEERQSNWLFNSINNHLTATCTNKCHHHHVKLSWTGWQTYMSTQHCGLTAPVASTTEYLFGAVQSTDKEEERTQFKCKTLNLKSWRYY